MTADANCLLRTLSDLRRPAEEACDRSAFALLHPGRAQCGSGLSFGDEKAKTYEDYISKPPTSPVSRV
ncbi:hypothetical protein Tco_1018292 [Tanacetum coccineum]|uniref:Uncharacterized protein n=1 Tax=Tanacetum coccineum TaxID=301880 RepID=A0ABQ5FTY6_9ASTR